MIDFVITRQKDHSDVKITRSHRGTECWSDHRLVRSKLKYSSHSTKHRNKSSALRKLNIALLKNPAKAEELEDAIMINNKLADVTINRNIESSWKELKEALASSSKEVLSFSKRRGEDWFDENDTETAKLIENIYEKHKSHINDKNSTTKKRAYLQTKS